MKAISSRFTFFARSIKEFSGPVRPITYNLRGFRGIIEMQVEHPRQNALMHGLFVVCSRWNSKLCRRLRFSIQCNVCQEIAEVSHLEYKLPDTLNNPALLDRVELLQETKETLRCMQTNYRFVNV